MGFHPELPAPTEVVIPSPHTAARRRHSRWLGLGLVLWAIGCQSELPLPALNAPALRVRPDAATQPVPSPAAVAVLPAGAGKFRADLLAGLNAERQKRGLEPMTVSETLNQLADYHTTRMIEGDFFSHVDPYDRSNVGTRAAKFNYPFVHVGENLAAGQRTADQVLADWLASPAHRTIILDPDFTEVGSAVLDGGRFARYWTLELGRRIGS